MKLVNRISNIRFSNMESISFLASEKSTASRKTLKQIKDEVSEMDNLRSEYRKS